MKRINLLLAPALVLLTLLCACGAREQKPAVTLFLPNDDATGFVEQSAALDGDSAQAVVDALSEAGALPGGVEVLSCSLNGTGQDAQLSLDLSAAFGEAMQSAGSAGETMALGSLTNTMLAYFDAQTLLLTCEGEPLATGHNVYDEPLRFVFPEPVPDAS